MPQFFFSKVSLLKILQGICSLTYNIIPSAFPVQSSVNGTDYLGGLKSSADYLGTQNWLTGNVLSIFLLEISNTSILF